MTLVERRDGDTVRLYVDEGGETLTAWLYREGEDGKMLGWKLEGKLTDFPNDLLCVEDFERSGINPIDNITLTKCG